MSICWIIDTRISIGKSARQTEKRNENQKDFFFCFFSLSLRGGFINSVAFLGWVLMENGDLVKEGRTDG